MNDKKGIFLIVNTDTNRGLIGYLSNDLGELFDAVAEKFKPKDGLMWTALDYEPLRGFKVTVCTGSTQRSVEFVVLIPSNRGDQYLFEGKRIAPLDLIAKIAALAD